MREQLRRGFAGRVGASRAERISLSRATCQDLTVDLVGTLFEFGSPPFIVLREQIWLESFSGAAKAGKSIIFTFAPENTVRPRFIARTVDAVERHGGQVVFVELLCPEEEIERRIEDQSRARFGKLRSRTQYRELRAKGVFSFPPLPPPHIRVDTTKLTPKEAADQIAAAWNLGRPPQFFGSLSDSPGGSS